MRSVVVADAAGIGDVAITLKMLYAIQHGDCDSGLVASLSALGLVHELSLATT